MSPVRRAPMDPLPPAEELHPRRPDAYESGGVFASEDRRRPRADGVPGPALVLAIVGIPLLACAAFAVWWLAR